MQEFPKTVKSAVKKSNVFSILATQNKVMI